MSNKEIIAQRKDRDYFQSLREEQRSLLPKNSPEIVELSDEDMEAVAGGTVGSITVESLTAFDDVIFDLNNGGSYRSRSTSIPQEISIVAN